jgi:hypothetical protein
VGRKQRRKAGGRPRGPASGGGNRWRTVALLVIVGAAVALAVASWQSSPTVEPPPTSPGTAPGATPTAPPASGPPRAGTAPARQGEAPDRFRPLLGEWVRPDGGYVLAVSAISEEGEARVAYLNPRPIHVARAEARTNGESVGLFVELRDRGYPGSTYTLVHEARTDQLRGLYFQALQRASYDVVFVRR